MASATEDREGEGPDGVEFVREDDGTVTARDLETGLARGGESRAEALAHLAEVLELHEGGGESIEHPDQFLREELDIEPHELETTEELPDFLD